MSRQEQLPGEYYVVALESQDFHLYIGNETAAQLGRILSSPWWVPKPRWLKFVDRNGSRTWLRTCEVRAIYESTPQQRYRDMAFTKSLTQEDRSFKRG
jgi:hypothetical protein